MSSKEENLLRRRNNSKEKEPRLGSFSVIGTCGEVSACLDLLLSEEE